MDKDGKVRPQSNTRVRSQPGLLHAPDSFSTSPAACGSRLGLRDALKLQEIGLGAFERGVGAPAFSVAVSWPWCPRPPFPCLGTPLVLHQEASEALAFLSSAQLVLKKHVALLLSQPAVVPSLI